MAPAAMATHGQESISGSYAAGSPAWVVTDACDLDFITNGATNGVDSSCVALPAQAGGHGYALTADSGVGVVGLSACFWDSGGGFIACSPATVPANAAMVSVGSLAGVNVAWTMTIG